MKDIRKHVELENPKVSLLLQTVWVSRLQNEKSNAEILAKIFTQEAAANRFSFCLIKTQKSYCFANVYPFLMDSLILYKFFFCIINFVNLKPWA